jgi:exonuclease VII small subunit
MLELYQEGSELIKVCLTKLDDVEKKISVLSTGSSGEIEEQPLEKE